MQGYDVDIDFAKSSLNLFSQKHCRGSVVYWTKTGYVVVPLDMDRAGHIRIPVTTTGLKVISPSTTFIRAASALPIRRRRAALPSTE